ncbi:MAG TPA: FAD-dependent oxidoreductase [Termitinemataceae bacterium]|nr:FAD-dependent oxidoreductase [Termitinemataceae bacterium]HOM24205.1 FAD-dependent oxidoreductase [Termitinemataceae bacterium]HPQ01230.1 FAD-dependent oxidoreductase [Termitinemataceae bacterium]
MVNNRYVIVGGVAAGATAAARIRRLDEDAEIVLLERGPYVSFANCGLPYHIGGDIEKRSKLLLQTPEGFFSRYRVNVRLSTEAVNIDRAAKKVLVRSTQPGSDPDKREEVPYDALLLAQGGTPVIPPLPGVELPHVFKLWTIPDMDRILAYLKTKNPKTAVVVGGGFIGLETAEAFIQRGLSVTIVELTDHLMPPMDYLYGKKIQERFEQAGAQVYVSRGVAAIQEGAVQLNDGTAVPADMVLLSVGVRPNVELAKDAGLALGATGALLVDEYLQTSDPWIWAAGDMVEIVSRVSGEKVRVPLAGPANRQGRLAATNMVARVRGTALNGAAARGNTAAAVLHAGNSALSQDQASLPKEAPVPRAYRGALGTSVVKVFDETAALTGLSLAAARRMGFSAREVTIQKAHHATYYPGAEDLLLTLVFDEKSRKLLGAQAYGKAGADKRIDALAVALFAGLSIDDLGELDFAYAPPYSSANDPINMAAFVAQNSLDGYSPTISVSEAVQELAREESQRPLLVDVRTYGEYAREHMASALHIPLDELRDRLEEIPRDRPVRLISAGGFEGHLACRILLQKGWSQVASISGGWAALRYSVPFEA